MKNSNKSGFTLSELIVVIVLIALLCVIAVPSFNSVSNSVKKKTNETKINLIKIAAEKYATENNVDGQVIINVKKLVEDGFLEADSDEIPYLKSPINNESMDEYLVNIVYDSGQYEIEVIENNDSSISGDTDSSLLDIFVYKYSNGNIIGNNINNNQNVSEWTNGMVMVKVVPKVGVSNAINSADITGYFYSLNGVYTNKDNSVYTGGNTNGEQGNLFLIDTSYSLNNDLVVGVTTNKGIFSNTVIIRIDKELPTVESNTSGSYEINKKTINIVGSDGSGSGIKAFYVFNNVSLTCPTNASSYNIAANNGTATYNIANEGTYYICAIDEALNVSSIPYILDVGNIVKNGPAIIKPVGKNNWTKDGFNIKFGCDINSPSGCKSLIKYSVYDETNKKYIVKNATANEFLIDYFVNIASGLDTKSVTVTWDVWNNLGIKSSGNVKINAMIDKKAPVCTTSGSPGKWVNYNVTLTGTCNDQNGSGCVGKTVSNVFQSDMNTSKSPGTVYDKVGNSTNCPVAAVKIDKTPPTITNIAVNSSDVGYNTFKPSVSATLVGESSNTSNGYNVCFQTSSNVNNCKWRSSGAKASINAITLSKNYDGHVETIYIFAKDNVGNVSSKQESYRLYKECNSSGSKTTYCSGFSGCSKDCGGGEKSRSCQVKDKYTGASCGGTYEDRIGCNQHECPRQDSGGGGGDCCWVDWNNPYGSHGSCVKNICTSAANGATDSCAGYCNGQSHSGWGNENCVFYDC